MTQSLLFHLLGVCVVASPAALLAVLGLAALFDRPVSERAMARSTQAAVCSGLVASIAVLAMMLVSGTRHVPVELGNWVHVGHDFHFHLRFVFDRLSVPFAILSFVLIGTIGAFANVYLHRDPGYGRFFVLYAVFLLGMVVSSLAGTIETLFLGWELVGLSSTLLVAYFHERPAPVRNGLRVWSVYRVADAAFLVAALVMHHFTGEGNFDRMMGTEPWPGGQTVLTANQALIVGLLLLFAAAGKSALVPFSGWLPRAMEGPTPSSAVFYGSLSVHLGAFLLLRVSPILDQSVWLQSAVVALGLITALYAAVTARVQADIKTALAFASLTQVGLIVTEIGLGLRYVALVHIIGHACLRTLQLLRAPTLIHDYHTLENAIGDHLPQGTSIWTRTVPEPLRLWVYRFALERGYFDALLFDVALRPFVRLFQWCDAMERRWTDLLSRGLSRESDAVPPVSEALERAT